jgi:small subunit ribosomal protein S18
MMRNNKTISIGQVARSKKVGRTSDVAGEKNYVDYKNTEMLKKFVNRFMKIEPARRTGLTSKGQRALTRAIKRARHLSLLSYTLNHRH